MSNIMNFLICIMSDIIEDGWNIIFTHILKGELPKWWFFGIKCFVHFRIFVSPGITYPYIVASVCKHKNGGSEFIITNASIRGVQETMLPKNHFLFWLKWFLSLCLHSKDPISIKHIYIISTSVCNHHQFPLNVPLQDNYNKRKFPWNPFYPQDFYLHLNFFSMHIKLR